MASLASPLAAGSLRQRSSTTTLLNLDCSADLTSYSRSLGPTAQAAPFPLSSEALRAQFESHRENMLRHRQALGYISASPAQTPHLSSAETPVPPGNRGVDQHLAPAPPAYRHPPPSPPPPPPQTHIPTPHLYRQPHAVPPPQSRTPVPDAVESYPPALRLALERSSEMNNMRSERNIVYNVLEAQKREHESDTIHVIGTHKNLHAANLAAAEHMMDVRSQPWISKRDPDVDLQEDGSLNMGAWLEPYNGNRVRVYVQLDRLRG